MQAPTTLSWPASLNANRFLDEYWQRKPLWMPQALAGFETPLPADELAGLALEPDVSSRLLVEEDDGRFSVEHAPLPAERFETLHGRLFSLLVPDVDKHLPALADWLRPFEFLPSWRMDDLMISYAPDGGSVGAHIDAYDVFLLQASGSREWFIDSRPTPDSSLVADSDVRQLANFSANESCVLHPGDILYLPPGVPHHGIARGDHCTTWSIGFRAPSPAQLTLAVVERLAHSALSEQPVDDPQLELATPGEITTAHLQAYRDVFRRCVDIDDAQFAAVLGEVLSTHGEPDRPDQAAEQLPSAVRQAPWARLAWIGDAATVQLFANGETLACARDLAIGLCARAAVTVSAWSKHDRALLQELFDAGLVVDDNDYR